MLETLTYAIVTAVGVVIWGVRLEGRVNTNDKVTALQHKDLKELISTRFDAVDKRLDRVERSMNGHLVKE